MSLNHLDLNLLKALDALLREGSVTKAAEKLALTQPAVSAMLNRLRYRFNDPLFVRTLYGMQPTSRALVLAEPLQRILGEIETLIAPEQFDPATLSGQFIIAATDNNWLTIGTPFVLKIQQLAPQLQIAFVPIQGQDMEQKLTKGEWQLAVGKSQDVKTSLHQQTLYEEHYRCILRADHPVLQQEWHLARFCELDFAIPSYLGRQFYGEVDKALNKLGRSRRVTLSASTFLVLLEIIQQSDLAVVVPRSFAHKILRQNQNLIGLSLPFDIPSYTKVITWHDRTHYDPAQQWLRQQFMESAEEDRQNSIMLSSFSFK